MTMEIKETMPLQEMAEKLAWKRADGTQGPARVIREHLERGFFDPYEPDVLEAWRNTDKADRAKFMNTLHEIKLQDLLRAATPKYKHTVSPSLREFLASSGTTGIAGAYYMIPVKLWDDMMTESVGTDVVGAVSKVLVGPEAMQGTTMKVDVAVDGQYIVNVSTSGAIAPTETIETVQCTLDCSSIMTINFRLGNDLIEDGLFDVVAMHVQEAGRQIGEDASNRALTILGTAPDGDGTLNACTSVVGDVSKWYDATGLTDDIQDGIDQNAGDGFDSDLLVTTKHCMGESIMGTTGIGAGNISSVWDRYLSGGWPTKIGPLNVIYTNCDYLSNSKAFTNCISIIATKDYSLFSARKRWMRLEQYSEPVKDLTGAVISYRQDSVSLYKDSITTHTES